MRFDVHIFPCDKVRIVRSCYGRADPKYPILPHPDEDKKADNVIFKHIKEEIVCPTPQTPR
ncbi:hypothetical protein CSC18_2642 [Klebsiella aerogenes]|nr:hypothetical protein CSC18_2642 [Klebsiella aerogenes]